MLRRLTVLSLCLGCLVAILASGRFTPRLIVDGMVSFAFVPVCELAGFAVSRRFLLTRGRFTDDAGQFLRGNTPWLVWILATIAIAGSSAVPRSYETLNRILLAAVLPMLASMWLDYQFFLRPGGRRRVRAAAAVVTQRAVAWPLAASYFLGMAVSSRDVLHTVAEVGRMVSDAMKAAGT
jgi:hypothetical protein